MLLAADLEPTGPLETFSPCDTCGEACRVACPRNAFSTDGYHKPRCQRQMDADVASKVPAGDPSGNGTPWLVITYCRACELACPVGA
jgi:epoxyqueuosine reductase QueG